MKKGITFIASVLAGVSLGILFAPEKGKTLRNKLAKSSDKLGAFGKELLSAAEDASQEVQKILKRKDVQDLISSGKAELEDLYKTAEKKGKKLSAKAKKELKELTDAAEKKVKHMKKMVSSPKKKSTASTKRKKASARAKKKKS